MDYMSDAYRDDKSLREFAEQTARELRPRGESGGAFAAARLRRRMETVRRSHEAIRRRWDGQPRIPAACEWLLDNWYLARREYLAAAEALRRARRLRRAGDDLLILSLSRALLRAGAGGVTEQRCRVFLDGFQRVTALRRAELDLFPAALRAAALELLAEICGKLPYAEELSAFTQPLEAVFTTLRLLSALDMEALLSAADLTGAVLCADPAGAYAKMDRQTRQDYLRRVEKLARRAGMEELSFARALVRRARAENRHVGALLFEEEADDRGPGLYLAAVGLLTVSLSLLGGFALRSLPATLLLLLPLSELVKRLTDLVLSRAAPPRRLPRMDMRRGVPEAGRTVCVVSALLDSEESAAALIRRLEELRLACRSEGENLCFGLLADLPAADAQSVEADGPILRAAETGIRRLNREYRGGFYLFTRRRSFDGERWVGRERKRGALTELARLLCDRESSLLVEGDRDALCGVRYILTLDSDTQLYPGAAGELIGAMLHPLNRPQIDPGRRVVVRGHGLLQPRIDTELQSANATDFALIFAGPGGSDPYGALCGELYMDAFGASGFSGKGILDARCYLDCLEGRVPEGRVLSHDAVEGAFLRAGYLGDTAFADAFPCRPLSYFKRLHRWVRGDWQNLPWLFKRELSTLSRWQLFDSLRRSLLPPMTLLAIAAGLLLEAPGLSLSAWAALLALLSHVLTALTRQLRQRVRPRLRRYTRLLTGAGGAIVQGFLRLWLLPHEAWVCLTAILTALWRMGVSRKNLLQWQTAAQSEAGSAGLLAHWRAMWPASLLGLALLLFSPSILGRSAGLLWLLSPVTAFALALPAWREPPLPAADREYLRDAAAKSFSYFRRFCTEEEHYLPPDNFQDQPPAGLAHRTSPTNIGLCLVSAVAAADMELLRRAEAVAFLTPILTTLEQMPKRRGHLYNWYDTRTLRPLRPAYLSTVDSGNLCASLITLRAALREWGEAALAERAGALLEAMDFAMLYDERRGLFAICWDAEKERRAGGWYDLLASEAMLTSYLAVARGEAPKKHWRRLSRAQLQKDGYRGLASWTGTMFEYLMPALFLPLYRGSLLYETGRFCLYAQKRRPFPGKPWGVSESAYFSLDAQGVYRYKASGCAALALKRGQDADLVVSPYSSFLALAVEPQAALRNLRRLERFGAVGRFGFWEALDFTPARCRRDSGEKVRCVMAHHLGMSVIAAANALCGGSIRRRFLSDPAMAAHVLLLQERLPEGGEVLRRELSAQPEPPRRGPAERWTLRGEADSPEQLCLLSNGSYHALVSGRACGSARCGELLIYEEMGFDRSPGRWTLSEDLARFELGDWSVQTWVSAGELGQLWELRPEADAPALCLSLSPRLCREEAWRAHPAFWRLGLEAEETGEGLLLHRLRRGEQRALWLCLRCDGPAAAGFDRPRLQFRCRFGGGQSSRLALCLGSSREEALQGAARMLCDAERGDMPGAAALRLGLVAGELGEAMALLRPLTLPLAGGEAKAALWPYGLSGDLPLLCCEAGAVEALPLLRRFLLLKSCGMEAELVYLSGEQGEYRQPFAQRIGRELSALELEALLGARGGVFFAPLEAAQAIRSRAAWTAGLPERRVRPLKLPELGGPRQPGFAPDFRFEKDSFVFRPGGALPGRAWQLILSNGSLGCILSECGPAALWRQNAREQPLTAFQEDVRDTGGPEALWAELDGESVSLFAANDGLPCTLRYEPGAAVWEKALAGRRVRTTVFVDMEEDARVILIEGARDLHLRWCLRPLLAGDASSLRCAFSGGLFRAEDPACCLPDTALLAACSVFADADTDYTPPGLRLAFLGAEQTVLVCGCCGEEALRRLCRPESAGEALLRTRRRWRALLGPPRRSGDEMIDRLLWPWLPYQTLACRLWGRGSLYQRGGAYGFRDQLQDAVNLLPLDSAYARERILDCCRHQYVEGDVLHWWHPHPAGDRGVRTRCSDDLLWLVWALCETVDATGDAALCETETAYISSPPLRPEERDRYETPERSGAAASVLFHAKAALDLSISRGFGAHGLPFFGSGDWNDGLDAVDGESVWLGFFLAHCAGRFADLLDRLEKPGAGRYRDCAGALLRACEGAWNGRFYRRGWWADGEPLGGEERIDLLPQAWAALCGAAHADEALDAAMARLVDTEHRLVRLFDPPFGEGERYPGYLAGYGAGVRENGGQYTHGAIWLALALSARGRAGEGRGVLSLLLPEGHDAGRYEAEPFVLAADVCGAPGREGEAGWTWYTGSAGWFLRAAEKLFPTLPKSDAV